MSGEKVMLNITPNHIKSRAKQNKAAWCVDTRSVLADGRQQFYRTKEDALHAIKKLDREATIDARTSTSWKWTFAELRKEYMKRVKADFNGGNKSKTFYVDKERHSRQFLDFEIDGKPVAEMRVSDMTMGMMDLDIMDQMAEGRSEKTVENMCGSIAHMFIYSIKRGCRETNPLDGVERRGEFASEDFKAEQIAQHVIDAIMAEMSPEWALEMRTACTTGLRQGEQRALTWGCLDLDNSKVKVTRAVKHRAGIGDPKSYSGKRTIALTRDLVQSLKELYIRKGRPNDPSELVFCTKNGNEKSPSKYLKAIHKACDAAGVERIRWHDLRHYYASKLLMLFPNDLYRVKSYMGHATIAITQSTYGHWLEDEGEDTEAVDKLSAAF
jgi:integrase